MEPNETHGGGTPPEATPPVEQPPAENLDGLKSALAKERAAAKELRAQLTELRSITDKSGDAAKELEQLRARLGEIEFRDRRSALLQAAIQKTGAAVDIAKAERLVAKLGNPATIEADIAEIVEVLTPPPASLPTGTPAKAQPTSPPPLRGQPPKSGQLATDLPKSEWTRLAREDPEGYRAMIEARRAGSKFKQ